MKLRAGLSAFPVALAAVLCAFVAPAGDEERREGEEGEEEVELDEAEVFIEWNSTDGDFGIQFFWDGDPWDRMKLEGPDEKTVLRVAVQENLADQGMTEGFFESAEPSSDELSMEEFFERFPEGEYEYEGESLEGEEMEGETELTHTLPTPPVGLFPAKGDVVNARKRVVLGFDAVTLDIVGKPLTPVLYEIVLEHEADDLTRIFTVTLPGDVPRPQVTVPPEFMQPGAEYKLEVIVQEESGNRTISETEFATL